MKQQVKQIYRLISLISEMIKFEEKNNIRVKGEKPIKFKKFAIKLYPLDTKSPRGVYLGSYRQLGVYKGEILIPTCKVKDIYTLESEIITTFKNLNIKKTDKEIINYVQIVLEERLREIKTKLN